MGRRGGAAAGKAEEGAGWMVVVSGSGRIFKEECLRSRERTSGDGWEGGAEE